MSVEKLGDYRAILRALHWQAPANPQPPAVSAPIVTKPVVPVTPAKPAPASMGRDTFIRKGAPNPDAFFISQVRDPKWNPTAPRGNKNCGPTSLAMALKALGLQPPGLTNPSDREAWIDRTRMAMEGDQNDFKLTSDDDVLRGALKSGAQAQKVHGMNGVEQALSQGKLVVLAGNPVAYENRLTNAQYDHFNGGHFILVSARKGNEFQIEDPQAHLDNFWISGAELQAYMGYQGWNVGIAVWR